MRVITQLSTFNIDGIRHLRLWHWRQAMQHRVYEQSKADPVVKARAEKKIGFHLKQVQLLNDFFPIFGDTAEMDAAKQPRHK